jgi:hypothetical protein
MLLLLLRCARPCHHFCSGSSVSTRMRTLVPPSSTWQLKYPFLPPASPFSRMSLKILRHPSSPAFPACSMKLICFFRSYTIIGCAGTGPICPGRVDNSFSPRRRWEDEEEHEKGGGERETGERVVRGGRVQRLVSGGQEEDEESRLRERHLDFDNTRGSIIPRHGHLSELRRFEGALPRITLCDRCIEVHG